MEWTVRTSDNRTLAVEERGDPKGRPVLVHMGTPNSRHLYGPHVTDAAERGLRLISYDRPGYGDSTSHPGRTVADSASDVRAICEHLGIGRLAMWGISGGGPHVLACAALLPDLVTAVASLASLAPYGAEGLDWFAGMGQDNVQEFRLLLTDEPASRVRFEQLWKEFLATTASTIADRFESLLSPTDAAALNGELVEHLAYAGHAALAPGWQGWWDDNRAHIGPWGFEITDISVPVLLLHGRQDKFVPFGHGQWLAAHIPGIEARLLDDDGHVTLHHRVDEVHTWLAEHLDQSNRC